MKIDPADTGSATLVKAPRTTLQPPALGVFVVSEVGSDGVGVGVVRFGTATGLVATESDPVVANSGATGFAFAVSHDEEDVIVVGHRR